MTTRRFVRYFPRSRLPQREHRKKVEMESDNSVDGSLLHRAAYPELYVKPEKRDVTREQTVEANDLSGSPLGYGGVLEQVRVRPSSGKKNKD